ncbi:ead/Ea22-like family protein [Enterobacter asburiae]|uniref:ead/Ea22-like family protein n=1 Tax=Enterobacter asburiae TaxID=61645 RepID=UPI00207638AA|nr:ead/Ea22-like family protein [Enterobacter asburiae]MCM7668178.1 ead/Ea22-like family protein [Enterobacter asburiae]
MSNIDKRALREAAEKAGSDKWQAKKINGDFYVIRNGSYEKQHGITSYQPIAEIEHKPVRDYVAAANPATVLALLDEMEAKDRRIAELSALQGKPIAWESTTPVYVKFITDERYQRLRPGYQKWYKPYRCSQCAAAGKGEAS